MSDNNQLSLTDCLESATDRNNQPSRPDNSSRQTDTDGSRADEPSALTDLYDAVSTKFVEAYDDVILDLDGVLPPTPQTKVGRTSGIPDGIPIVPESVGAWQLDYYSTDRITYRISGTGCSDGDTAGVVVRRYLRPAPRRKPYDWVIRSEKIVGLNNPNKVATASTHDEAYLKSRYWSAGEDGDYGVTSGALETFKDSYEALVQLLTSLHGASQSLPTLLYDVDLHDAWTLTSQTLTRATWQAPAPPRVPADTVSLRLTPSWVALTYDSPTGAPARSEYHPLPLPDPALTAITEVDERTTTPSLAVGAHLAVQALSHAPATLLRHSHRPLATAPSR